jgi:hypothetical protein
MWFLALLFFNRLRLAWHIKVLYFQLSIFFFSFSFYGVIYLQKNGGWYLSFVFFGEFFFWVFFVLLNSESICMVEYLMQNVSAAVLKVCGAFLWNFSVNYTINNSLLLR